MAVWERIYVPGIESLLNQAMNDKWILRNKNQWNLNQNIKCFFLGIALEYDCFNVSIIIDIMLGMFSYIWFLLYSTFFSAIIR